MKKVIMFFILMVVLCGAFYYIGSEVNKEVEYIETVIDLTNSEKKQVIQKARLNWMSLDSAYNLIDLALADDVERWNIRDSTHWTFKDSTVFKDSTFVMYVPYFEAKDTIVTFDETDSLKQIRVQLSLAVKPRYFPTYQKFLTDVQMRELTITQPEHVDSWWKHRWVVYAGYGIGYSFQAGQRDHYNNGVQTLSHNHEGWYHGFQFGIGVRLY